MIPWSLQWDTPTYRWCYKSCWRRRCPAKWKVRRCWATACCWICCPSSQENIWSPDWIPESTIFSIKYTHTSTGHKKLSTNLIQLRVRKIVIRVKYFFFVISHHSYLFDSENPRLIIMTNMRHCCTQFIFVTFHCLCLFITVTLLTRGWSGWFTSLPCITLHSTQPSRRIKSRDQCPQA